MNRGEAIRHIEDFLHQAKQDVAGWRTETTEVLIRFAQLCIEKEETPDFMRSFQK